MKKFTFIAAGFTAGLLISATASADYAYDRANYMAYSGINDSMEHMPATASGNQPSHMMMKDIIDTAISAGKFNTLVTAVKQAGLVETLKGEGPFTVFAPTDEAFEKIPAETLNALLADKKALTNVLTYHVVAGKVMAADVVQLASAETVQGQSVRINSSNGVMVDNAKVVMTDIETSNGVIHVIDSVILPK
ncbi:fasciclin domain-containing protein [Sedimenticola selenatireducens]